ncbi:hypothetical protein CKAH01_03191 [Colletotrichum kahawae]|uniref:Ubiquitin-like domain-containing protein n=1 Tax=Colletotrichum kahawae TaxID=34407 RepID=A0AAD9YV46_COLKA|nr:hypothetical protein CKAH01_03191 [Colletotrichum kahawae]
MADAAKPKKRLPFKPTALRQKAAPKPVVNNSDDEDNDDGISLFNRGASVFEQERLEQERQRKRKQAEREKSSQAPSPGANRGFSLSRASEDPSHETNHHHEDFSRGPDTPPSKRSRTSDESPESRIKPSPSKRAGTETPSKRMTRAAASRTPRKQEPLPSKPVISIDDSDDDEDDIYDASPIRKPIPEDRDPSPLVIDDDDDDPFEEKNVAAAEDDDDEMAEYIRAAKERKEAQERLAREQSEDAKQVVVIFVTSDIPGVVSKQFKFTLSKPIKVLRNAWIDVHSGRLDLPQSEINEVFLTWRGHRLYDLTTLNSLDLQGEYRKTTGGQNGFKDDWTKVHMEMWTPALWEDHERQVARQRRHDRGEYSDDEGGDGGDETVEAEPEEQKIKVLLKTKTDEPLKTSVRPSTKIGTIMELFRKMRGLAPDAPITLMFDGDELEEDVTVADADIGDMETIEVYIR